MLCSNNNVNNIRNLIFPKKFLQKKGFINKEKENEISDLPTDDKTDEKVKKKRKTGIQVFL